MNKLRNLIICCALIAAADVFAMKKVSGMEQALPTKSRKKKTNLSLWKIVVVNEFTNSRDCFIENVIAALPEALEEIFQEQLKASKGKSPTHESEELITIHERINDTMDDYLIQLYRVNQSISCDRINHIIKAFKTKIDGLSRTKPYSSLSLVELRKVHAGYYALSNVLKEIDELIVPPSLPEVSYVVTSSPKQKE